MPLCLLTTRHLEITFWSIEFLVHGGYVVHMRIENLPVENYNAILKDKYRPPSKGGNTRAWHQHVLTIDGQRYSVLALGAKKWVFAGDTVSFEWDWDATSLYRNIDPNTVTTRDRTGQQVLRGERGDKQWRSAKTRLPARRSEWKD